MLDRRMDRMGHNGIVYIVDDDIELCNSLAWLLESVSIQSCSFQSVKTFLEYLEVREGVPGCIVLDVRMPEVGGFELQDILVQRESHIPIVFVSAHGDIRMTVRALQQGALTFLEKPYDPQHIVEVLQHALRLSRERTAEHESRRALEERLARLSPRERDVLRLVIDGLPSKLIARDLGISVKTVDVHRTRIKEKTDTVGIAVLVRDLLQAGVVV